MEEDNKDDAHPMGRPISRKDLRQLIGKLHKETPNIKSVRDDSLVSGDYNSKKPVKEYNGGD